MAAPLITRTPIHDDDGSGTKGTIIDNAWKQELYGQIDADVAAVVAGMPAAIPGAWTNYTPIWSTFDASVPVIGNGTLIGRYVQIGKTVHFSIQLVIGSTTTMGSGSPWTFSTPPPASLSFGIYGAIVSFLTSGGAAYAPGLAYPYSGTSLYLQTAGAPGAIASPTVPFTWTAVAQLIIRGTYEAA